MTDLYLNEFSQSFPGAEAQKPACDVHSSVARLSQAVGSMPLPSKPLITFLIRHSWNMGNLFR